MEFKISFEKTRQKKIVDNTLKICNRVCDIVAGNKDISIEDIKRQIGVFMADSKIAKKETDSSAINTRIKECKNGDTEHRNWYEMKSVFTFYDERTLKLPKLNHVKLGVPTGFDKQMMSKDKNKTIRISNLSKSSYCVDIDENLIVESENSIATDHEWDELYYYVKDEILKYKDKDSLPPNVVLRLRGLTEGKYMANRSVESKAEYTYKQVLMTFKFCKLDIQEAERRKKFKSEQQRWNYIAKIVENKIIEVVRRMDYIAEQERVFNQKSEYIDIGTNVDISDRYVKKTKKLNPRSRLNDLW